MLRRETRNKALFENAHHLRTPRQQRKNVMVRSNMPIFYIGTTQINRPIFPHDNSIDL